MFMLSQLLQYLQISLKFWGKYGVILIKNKHILYL